MKANAAIGYFAFILWYLGWIVQNNYIVIQKYVYKLIPDGLFIYINNKLQFVNMITFQLPYKWQAQTKRKKNIDS